MDAHEEVASSYPEILSFSAKSTLSLEEPPAITTLC